MESKGKPVKEGAHIKSDWITEEDVLQGTPIPHPNITPKDENSSGRRATYDPHTTTTKALFGSFEPFMVEERLKNFWERKNSEFGKENLSSHYYLAEIITDRYTLLKGFQLIRDELQFAGHSKAFHEHDHETGQEIANCGADLAIPSVVSTQAYTNCGDRFNSEAHSFYQSAISTRFATISELGSLKTEAFYPTGGGTDDGKTLAHVTVAHMLNDELKRAVYEGNKSSFALVNFDLFTHCGKNSDASHVLVGLASESEWRVQRAACGAIVGCLKAYNESNPVHRRLRSDLGEKNFDFLCKNNIMLDDSLTKINYLVAAAIISIQGMINTATACITELDERGVAHLTSSVTLNKKSTTKGLFNLYFGRATVFQKKVSIQSFGTDASLFSGILVKDGNIKRVQLFYDGKITVPVKHFGVGEEVRL